MQRKNVQRAAALAFAALVVSGVALGQPTGGWSTAPADQSNMVYKAYAAAAQTWAAVGLKYAQRLFGLLAVLDLGATAVGMVRDGDDLQGIVSKLIKWIMKTGFFLALLTYGQSWMGAIIGSFIKIGQEAGGGGVITPGAIMAVGLSIAAKLTLWSGVAAVIPLIGTVFGLAGMITALLVVLAFAIVALNFVITTIESFLVLGAGMIFLGFGGSQWTRPYTERYIGLAVSVGTRLMVLYMVVGLGVSFGQQWIAIINGMVPTSAAGAVALGNRIATGEAFLDIFGVLAGAFTYAGIAVMCPKLVASVASGALSMSGSDAIGFGVGVTMAGAGLASGGIAALSGASSILAGGGGGAAASSGATAGMGGSLSAGDPVFRTNPAGPASSIAASSLASSGTGSGGGSGVGMPNFGGGQGTTGVGSDASNYAVDPPQNDTGRSSNGTGVESRGSGSDASRSAGNDMAPASGVAPGPASIADAQGSVGSGGAYVPPPLSEKGGMSTGAAPENRLGDGAGSRPPGRDLPAGNDVVPETQSGTVISPPAFDGAAAGSEMGRAKAGRLSKATRQAVEPSPLIGAATSPSGAPSALQPVMEGLSGGAVTAAAPDAGTGVPGPSAGMESAVDAGGFANAVPGPVETIDSVSSLAGTEMPSNAPGGAGVGPKSDPAQNRQMSVTERLAAMQYIQNITDVGHAVAPPPPTAGKED